MRTSYILFVMALLLSFCQYFVPLTQTNQVIPIALINLSAGVALLRTSQKRRRQLLRDLLNMRVLAITLALPLIASIYPLLNEKYDRLYYAGGMTSILASLRILLSTFGLFDVLKSFMHSALLATAVFVGQSWELILYSASRIVRFNNFYFHPNTIGFIFASYSSVSLFYFFRTKKWRYLLYSLGSSGIVFLASSRGSLVSIAGAYLLASILCAVWILRWRNTQFRPGTIILSLVGVLGTVIACGFLMTDINGFIEYLSRALDLNSQYRGIDRDLSVRTVNWTRFFAEIEAEFLIYGHGLRSSDQEISYTIDNGPLVLLYDVGLIGATGVVGKYIATALAMGRWTLMSQSQSDFWPRLGSTIFLLTFLINNLSARYLFGLGNPFSLIALTFLVLLRQDLAKADRLDFSRGAARPRVRRWNAAVQVSSAVTSRANRLESSVTHTE